VLHCQLDHTWFKTDRRYWDLADRPVLGQQFEQHGPEWTPSANVRLPGWFAHLLPEGELRRRIADRARVNQDREFRLLRAIGGTDLPGALALTAASDGEIGAPAFPEELPDDVASAGNLKFSLAGVQLKFSVRPTDTGLVLPTSGADGQWIVKLPDPRFDGVPEAEHALSEFARSIGIDVPETKLIDVDAIDGLPAWASAPGARAFAIRRYDRADDGTRVHAEEFAQVLDVPVGGDGLHRYRVSLETIARTAFQLSGSSALHGVVDRLVFNVLTGNGDAHAKNWSFIYPDGIHPALSPAYDLVPTVAFIPGDDLGLTLGGSKAWSDVTLSAVRSLVDKAGADPTNVSDRVREIANRIVEGWDALGNGLSQDVFDRITQHRDGLALRREL